MKKVFLVHGFEGEPNGGWRPWLMRELDAQDIYACALPMPTPYTPIVSEWVKELERVIDSPKETVLVGHSLGAAAILRYLEVTKDQILGAVLVSGPIEMVEHNSKGKSLEKMRNFFDTPFDFEKIKRQCGSFVIIHGDNDTVVPFSHAERLSEALEGKLVTVPNGLHLSGGAGWYELPDAREAVLSLFN